MKILSLIRSLRVLQPRESNDTEAVIVIELKKLLRSSREQLTAGEAVTVGMVLLAEGAKNQTPGSMARAYTLSALTNLRDELDAQIIREGAIAKLIAESQQ